MEEDPTKEIEWDLEALKKAYLASAEEYDRIMNKEEQPPTTK